MDPHADPGVTGPAHPEPGEDRARPERGARVWMVVLPAVWLILGVGGAAAIVSWVRADAPDSSAASSQASSPAPGATSGATAPATSTATPKPKKTTKPTATKPTKPAVATTRTLQVGVYNRSRIAGLASRTAQEARQAGWTVAVTGNWSAGTPPQNTIYFPRDGEPEARLLGRDLGISRFKPVVSPPMNERRLTVLLVSTP